MDQSGAETARLKRIRANKKSSFTRICNRVDSLIAARGSRTLLQQLLGDIDRALDAVTEANESYLAVLLEEDEKAKAAEYMSEIEVLRDNTVRKMTEYLQSRSHEATSDASPVPSNRSAVSVARSHEATIEARLTALKLRQMERRLQREKEQDLKIQTVREQAEVAELEAKLRQQAIESVNLNTDRADNFEDEYFAASCERDEPERDHTSAGGRNLASGGGGDTSHAPDGDIHGVTTGHSRTADWIWQLNSRIEVPTGQQSQTARHFSEGRSVPRLSLPKFAGDPLEWPKWIGLFKALIHEQPGLSDAEKIVHLQSAVTGLAQQTIEGMLYDGRLYPKALQTLQTRFGRSEDIVFANLSAVFQSQPLKHMDTAALDKFQARLHCAITTLESLGYIGDVTSFENLRRAAAKLPVQLRQEWGKRVVELEPKQATLSDLDDWLALQVRISLSSAVSEYPGDRAVSSAIGRHRPSAVQQSARSALTTAAPQAPQRSSQSRCSLCNSQHSLHQCSVFTQKSVADRARLVADSGRCFRCLEVGHMSRRCPSTSAQRCSADGCYGRHHQLLHGSQRVFPLREASQLSDSRIIGAALSATSTTTLLQVVPVRVYGPDGSYRDTHALLDAGAQTSLCTDQLRQRLGIIGERQELLLNNVEGAGEKRVVQRFALQVSPLPAGDAGMNVTVQEVFSVPKLNVQPQTVDRRQRKGWLHLADLDIPDTSNKQIELLLGANVTEAVVQREARVGRPGQPVAVRTAFGWCLSGSVTQLVSPGARQVMHVARVESPEEELNSLVKEWWSTESFGTKFDSQVATSAEDRHAEQLLNQTTRWRGDRYETGLLWRSDDISLPDNYTAALRRLESTERKLLRHPVTAAAYQQTFQEYLNKGYARKLTPEEVEVNDPKRWFLPHHAVTNANKPGKIRVVFDAAASYSGTSLKSKLLTGPDFLQSIPGILLRFRKECIGISADIEQMYHQVATVKDDQAALSFLWRDLDTDRPPDVYQMDRIIFGARCSPASASYVLRKTAEDKFTDSCAGRAAAEAVSNSFYMDDFLSSEPDSASAVSSLSAVTELVSRGGFRLTKWLSNSRDVLAAVPKSERAPSSADLPSQLPTERVLGLLWDTETDQLKLQVQLPTVSPTKRGILQKAAPIYDPLGFASPFTVLARILMQKLWILQLDWDSELTGTQLDEWNQWLRELPYFQQLRIPRSYRDTSSAVVNRQSYVFGDASELAFGAVAYLRERSEDGSITCSFVMSKTRVAPLKQMTIVRLETQAVVLAVRLAETVRRELKLRIDEVCFWSDSMVVLQYIANDSRRFHTFIANRIAEIRQGSEPRQWRHVPGELNPADGCSRGIPTSQLIAQTSWLQGPEFLQKSPEYWPLDVRAQTPEGGDPEVRSINLTSTTDAAASFVLPDPSRFSCWTHYRRAVAWEYI